MVTLTIPQNIKVELVGQRIIVKGPLGELKKEFPSSINIEMNDTTVEVTGKDKALVNTFVAHIKNMFKGVSEGFKVKMKVLYAHFPITLEVKGKEVLIKNFLGEKVPRKAKILGDTKVEVKGQEVFISGIDKEAVGGTVSNLKQATVIKNRDPRVFQDGLYVVE
jgi:large subunit ribosomal protein L6